MSLASLRPVIAITVGDPAGVGPEIVAKTLRDPRLPRGFCWEVLGAKKKFQAGRSTRASARNALTALEEAADGCRAGKFAAMVTGPVQKSTIAQIQPTFVGQTEFLARRCGLNDDDAVMVLTDPKMTVALCTQHCALRDALKRLKSERIVYVARQTADFLRRLGKRHPRLALAGVNPHAGEDGLLGDEEARLLRPALAKLRGIATGPYAPDTVFFHAAKGRYDAVICAYHDQGLIPFKLVAFDSGVNVTLGLPIIRTSPDHGTALDLAGKGRANHHSMLAAAQLAARLVRAKSQGRK